MNNVSKNDRTQSYAPSKNIRDVFKTTPRYSAVHQSFRNHKPNPVHYRNLVALFVYRITKISVTMANVNVS